MKESVIYQEILAEGEQIGKQQATEKIALNLLSEKFDLALVSKVSNLTIDQVQALQLRLEEN